MNRYLATLLIATFSVPALATSSVSPRFDGVYSGVLTPTPWMSKPACPVMTVDRLVVKQGAIARDARAHTRFDGFVTDEGFVSGHMRGPIGPSAVFEGRIVDNTLSGGIIDENAGCAWTATLERKTAAETLAAP